MSGRMEEIVARLAAAQRQHPMSYDACSPELVGATFKVARFSRVLQSHAETDIAYLLERVRLAEADAVEGRRLVHALDEARGFRDLEIPAMQAVAAWVAKS